MAVIKRKGVVAGAALLLCIMLASSAGMALSKRYPTPLATAAGRTLSEDDFLSRYAEYLLKFGLPDNAERRRQFLDNLIDYYLAVQAARDEGIEESDAYRFAKETAEQKLLIDLYVEKALFDTLEVTERDFSEMFVRINTQLKARHLYARIRERADSLYERLQQGERFEDLAREVFADSVLANSGGSVGYFSFDEMDPAFEAAAYRLAVGEISRPVRTASGFSIIQVEDRMEKPVLTEAEFQSKKNGLRRLILERKRTEARSRLAQEITQGLDLEFDEVALARLLAQIRGELLLPDEETRNIEETAPLVTFLVDGERITWDVDEFRQRALYTSEMQRAGVASVEALKSLITGLAVREVMVVRARDLGLEKRPAFREALMSALDEWVYAEVRSRFDREVVVPEDSLRAHYEANREAYVIPDRVQVSEILLETKGEADRVKALLKDRSFSELARTYSIRPGADAGGGDLGFVGREQLGSLAEPVFAATKGMILGPLEIAGRYALLAVGERRASYPARFEEVSAEIASSMKQRLAREAFYTHLAQLRDQNEVVVDEHALMSLDLRLK